MTHFGRIRQENSTQAQPWGRVLRQTGIPEIPTNSRYIIRYARYAVAAVRKW